MGTYIASTLAGIAENFHHDDLGRNCPPFPRKCFQEAQLVRNLSGWKQAQTATTTPFHNQEEQGTRKAYYTIWSHLLIVYS